MSIFTKNITNSGDNIFALDLSDLSVKIFQLEKNGKNDRIRSYSSLDIPAGYIEDGRIVEKSKVIESIRLAVKKAGPKKINTKKVVCSIPESKGFLRIITIPKVEKEEVGEAVKWELEANIPLTSDQVYFDWQFLSEVEGKQNILTVAVSRDIVDNLAEVLTGAGLEIYGMEVESIASVRSLIPSEISPKETSLIVDIGAGRTSFIITEGVIPYFTPSIPFSSEMISDAIAGNLNVDKKNAEQIKINEGIERSLDGGSVFNAVKALLETLASEIEKTIDFYQNISKESSDIKKIIMCGGGSNLRGIVPYLTTRLSREIVVGDPWINLHLGSKLPIIDKESSVRYATAIGLALKKIDYGDQY